MATKKKKSAKRKKATYKKAARRTYVANPAPKKTSRRRRSYKKNPAPIMDYFIQFLAGIFGGVALPKLGDLAPLQTIDSRIKSGVISGIGFAAFVFGLVKKQPILAAAGFGAGIVSGTRLLVNTVPILAGEDELTMDETAALMEALNGDELEYNSAEALNAPLMGSPLMGSPLMGSPLMGAPMM